LACLREDIDQQPHQFKSILMEDNLRGTFFPDVKKDEKKVVAAFCKMSADNALKTKPKVGLDSVVA
jgi:predicted nucleotide-binding protein (sugar kinase/HSP70/actin superfamily)